MRDLIELAERSRWEPINAIIAPKWHQFFGRRIGGTTIGVAAAYAPTAWYFGIEFITGSSRGIAFCFGPLWVGFACLRAIAGEGE